MKPLEFFAPLVWLDGRPLLDTIEPYRRATFTEVLDTTDADGRPKYNRALVGRAKKNWKSADLTLAALYRFLAWDAGSAGNDAFIVANDEDQAADDLALTKKLIAVNPILDREVRVLSKEIARLDGKGALKILPAGDAAGAHGKTYLFLGFDEIHAYRNYDLIEALSPDPTRRDVLVWITSYSSILHLSGAPLYDMLERAKAGDDPRLYFSWYSASFTTDPVLQGPETSPEDRANPSRGSWDNPSYLDEQRARLPTGRFRRLHLNEPGSPEGAAFSADAVMACVVKGRRRLPYRPGVRYFAAVDMSGGSDDDAVFAIAHRDRETERAVLDLIIPQNGRPPFDPRAAVRKFADAARAYGCGLVHGDTYAGQTFRSDFLENGINYQVIRPATLNQKGQPSASDVYEAFEPALNAGEVELLDVPNLIEQLLSLVWKGSKITHESTGHDDWANAAAVALVLAAPLRPSMVITDDALALSRLSAPAASHAIAQRQAARQHPDNWVNMTPQERMEFDFGYEATFGPRDPANAPPPATRLTPSLQVLARSRAGGLSQGRRLLTDFWG